MEETLEIGDLVYCFPSGAIKFYGIVVGFNEKGEGGKDFVKVLTHSGLVTVFSFEVEKIDSE